MMESIQSTQNQWVKLAASLKQKKYRDESGLFLLEGIRLVEELVQSNWQMAFAFVTPEMTSTDRGRNLITQLEKKGPLYQISVAMAEKICDTKNPQGVVAVAKQQLADFDEVLPSVQLDNEKRKPLLLLADGIQDPGNLGTLLRTADAAGCHAVILIDAVDVFNPKVVRGSMGSLFHLPIIVASEALSLAWLEEHQISLYGTSLEESVLYYDVDLRQSVCIIFGNEGQGVREELLQRCKQNIHIPLLGKAESLNVSSAVAVVLYEAVRQRYQA
ncbi:TrmH family RNA methyltransferase [Sporomusaceae bacterium BoRhaA]|uniref:TrmH family RNA methyltransferase n=1 Tax=Pelorhabdus rhamnosifermentans TaxID=2772457 RepID=UPI001C05FA07|nr:RNA methyltransferase [Pelorhabdus rhamnosifermentans]MBU2701554.1 TrmH family RNA methyltransferase [Pelorhabdus rhamnosifermentans]